MNWTPFRCLILLFIIQGSPPQIDCTSEERLAEDTRTCQWRPWSKRHESYYKEIEQSLDKINRPIPVNGIERFYNYITETAINHIEEDRSNEEGPRNELRIWAYTQVSITRSLDGRHCLDHCTYVLARNSCNAGSYNHACMPRSSNPSVLKAMIDGKVFPMITRCQGTLIERAIQLNQTEIDSLTYEAVTYITNQMTKFYPTKRWRTIEDVMLRASTPFLAIRQLIKPQLNGFFFNLDKVMLYLEAKLGEDMLRRSIAYRLQNKDDSMVHYQHLVLRHCLNFIDIMHVAMDGAIYYGKIMDLNRTMFTMPALDDGMRLKFFELVHRYYACVYLDNFHPWDLMIYLDKIKWYN